MNPSLIAQITKEVLAELGASAKSGSPAAAAGSAPAAAKSILVIATGAQDVPAALSRIKGAGNHRIVLAVPKYGRSLLAGTDLSGTTVHYLDMGKPEECHLLAGADLVVLPTLETPLLNKVAQFRTDSWPAKQIVNALAQGKPVFVPGKGTETWAAKAKTLGLKVGGWETLFALQGGSAGGGDCNSCQTQGHCATKCSDKVGSALTAGAARITGPHDQAGVAGGLAGYIDHTLLKAEATEAEILKLCAEARQFKFASVCVNPGWVKLCASQLRGSGVMVCTVVGFPLGATSTAAKVCETRKALEDGADEIDMVLNVGALKSAQYEVVEQDIRAIKQACGRHTLKVILETSLLKDDEKVKACELSKRAGADFVKTSTGFGSGGATVADIALMRRTVGPEMGVKASGAVRDTQTAEAMIAAGATRIGASASIAIATGTAAGKGNY
jgi:deoxyribose-phosphate aldolase